MQQAKAESLRISDKETLEWSTTDNGGRHGSSRELERLAHLLDSVFEIPIIRLRFGIDALLGLVPGVGDTASAMASIYILQAAAKFGVSKVTLARMTLNIVIDLLFGAVPFIGDLFDVYWKANRQNVELMRRHIKATPASERKLKRSDALFVAGLIAAICGVLVASVAGAYFILSRLFQSLPTW